MRVACDGDAPAVEIARVIELAQLFQSLPAVEICRGVIRIGFGDGCEGGDRSMEIAGFDVFHRQSIAGERARRVLIEELLQDFDAGGFQTVRIPLVACPFFRPVRLMEWGSGRAPLGGIFTGECERGGAGDARLCNFGYARGLCAHFPAGTVADAVRFSVAESADGLVRLIWILEKDHAPLEHGLLEYRESTRDFVVAPEGILGAQARVFLENYLRR
jgi:hypothetical protein